MIEKSEADLLLQSYDYEFDESLIASKPIYPREKARLLVYERATNSLTHASFGDLPKFLPKCAIVFNDTKVIKARIYGHKESGAKIELFLHKSLDEKSFLAQIKGRVKKGEILLFERGLKAEIIELLEGGFRQVVFYQNEKNLQKEALFALLEKIGHIPLPPYIKRLDDENDERDYQSVFAKNEGAIAAPTASLHFSPAMLENLAQTHQIHYLTLHTGAGTFKSVECEDIKEHIMHEEYYFINENLATLLQSDEKILAVGTTSARAIENYVRTKQTSGFCKLFLHPYNEPKRVDYLLTNFHLPKSTLLMLVSSFISRKKALELYKEAVRLRYRFYSYGDAMLIL